VGVFAELGWEYDFNNGLGINASYQYMDMGDLDTSTLGVGLSYRF
jgi:opacity protein-like surface antigen